MSQIKINRALLKAKIGSYPSSASAMLDYVPLSVRDTLTSSQLAEMLDALWEACQAAKAIANREVVSDGAVWNARNEQFVELRH